MGFFDRFKSKFEQFKKKSLAKADRPSEVSSVDSPGVAVKTDLLVKEKGFEPSRALLYPYVTEKTADLAGEGKYVFVVTPVATKLEVKKAVQALYGTLPQDVNIVSMQGKSVRFGRLSGRRKDWKKAIVTMPAGKTLPIYE